MTRKVTVHIFLPLLLGLLTYLLFRSPDTLFHRAIGMTTTPLPLSDNPLNNFIKFHLADMCWAYALYSGLLLITGLNRWASATVALVALSLFEIVQVHGSWSRIDGWDIGYMCLAVLMARLTVRT